VAAEGPPGSLVVDASIVVKWLAREADSESALRIVVGGNPLAAPDLLPVEVANVLWKKTRRGDMTTEEMRPAITSLLDFGLELHQSVGLLARAADLAVSTGHPVYDCLYLALAAKTNAVLATADRRLQETAVSIGISVWEGV
jgi:predicted nucleic acid-binding protein